ncbi:MAG: EamA/RhaT family transporter [Betaproteobacteria bacterium]|nr:MAG: EamA/RhaT family transporter [Betaproteobacteria bacterium]TAG48546.1 MAG: EamA/RhaT family transporter [Betaproteobacteria bacterium]
MLRSKADFYNERVNAFKIGALFAATAQLGFAAKAIFIKLAYAEHPGLDAVTLLALRMIFSLPFFLAMAWWARRAAAAADMKPVPLTRRDWGYVLLLGFCGYYLASFLDFWGLQYISAGLERLILFTNPTIVVLLSALFFARPITRRVALALLLSYAGLALAYWHDLRITDNVGELVFGSFLVFASALSYAVYLLLGADITKRIGSMRFTAYMMLVATVFVLVQFALMRPLSALDLPMKVYAYCVGLAVFATAAPVWMMAEGLKRIGANDASMIGSIGPVVTIFLGALFLSEPVSLLQLTGASLVLGGVALISLRPKSDAKST